MVVRDDFLGRLESAVTGLRVKDPGAEDSEMGPLMSAGQRERVAAYVPDDAPVAFRGSAPDGPGFWYPPTVLAPVDPASPVWREEVFGPVVAVVPFDDEDDAVRIANDTVYGLAGGVWSGDAERAKAVARRIRTGQLEINGGSFNVQAPFGGFKQSGYGRELGPHGLEEFFEIKSLQL